MTTDELASALEGSPLAQATSAATALRLGWNVEVTQGGTCAELATTYVLRLENLRRKSSAHATQLATSTEEFVANLRERGTAAVMWFQISGTEEHEYMVACSPPGRPIGCMRTVSQLRVDKHRWAELWAEV